MIEGHLLWAGQTQSTAGCQSESHQKPLTVNWKRSVKIGLVSTSALQGLKARGAEACFPVPAQLRPVLLLDVQERHLHWSAAVQQLQFEVWQQKIDWQLEMCGGCGENTWYPSSSGCFCKHGSKRRRQFCLITESTVNLIYCSVCIVYSTIRSLQIRCYLKQICTCFCKCILTDCSSFCFWLNQLSHITHKAGIRPSNCTSQLT